MRVPNDYKNMNTLNLQAEDLNQTISKISPTVFSLLSEKGKAIYFPKKGILAQSADAKGKKINATIGIAVLDDGTPMRLPSIEKNLLIKPHEAFSYAPSPGRPELREKWKNMIIEKNPSLKGNNEKFSLPVVTSALTHGLSLMGYLFLDKDDEIIIPEPYWENYTLTFSNACHAKIQTFPVFNKDSFNIAGLKQKLNENNVNKKVILFNFPNNPSGYTPNKSEVLEIVKVLKESAESGNKIVIIIDDAYFGLVYEEGIERESLFSYLYNLHENILAVKLDGATKEDYVWGFRVGFTTFGTKNGNKELYSALESKLAGVIRGNISNSPNHSQSLLLKAYESPDYNNQKKIKFKILEDRHKEIKKVLNEDKYKEYFSALPYNSGYFMCIRLATGIDSESVRQLLLKEYDTGVINFEGVLRIAFSSVPLDKIKALFDNIYEACKKESMANNKIDKKSQEILKSINNSHVENIINKYILLMKPDNVVVLDDSKESMDLIRKKSIENNEEVELSTPGHTYHFDSPQDQGRDLKNTRVLIPKGVSMSKAIETLDKDTGISEIFSMMDGMMKGKTMYVKFYCLGPTNSKFSIPALQLTDSAYVIHSEDILYRQGYNEFKKLNGEKNFFHFIHSAGKIVNGVCAEIDKRRIYIDLEDERVFTLNNQYAGNSVGLKKLALRLAVSKSNKEDWLCEHMFIMGVKAHKKDRITYFSGAFPSACGKTSTAMISGQSIIGDDIAYIRPDESGKAMAVNVEQGIFGIIQDVNSIDDALIYESLTTPRELIFSNILINNSTPYWLGMGKELPNSGKGYVGDWEKGQLDKDGKEIIPIHKNARYTIRLNELENKDENVDNPSGVPISGFIYGGRDSDSSVPVCQALSWSHGVFIGSVIESETTATVTGAKLGVRKHNPMSNIEFLVVPLSVYINNHLKFGEKLDKVPLVFATNYFLKGESGDYLNLKTDKKVWLFWMEGRVHGDYSAIETPVGFIPKYDDLKLLFNEVFSRDYTQDQYILQFSIKTTKLIEKFERMQEVFKDEKDIPQIFFDHLEQQKQRLKQSQEKHNKEVISPFDFE